MTEQVPDEPVQFLGIPRMDTETVAIYGLEVPANFVALLYRPGTPHSVEVFVRVDPDTGPVPVGVLLHSNDRDKTYKDAVDFLKGAPLDALLRQALAAASNARTWNRGLIELGKPDGRTLTESEASELGARVSANEVTSADIPTPVRRRSITAALLREVADVYRKAYAAGNAPTQAVAQHFVITKPTAARWVREARKAGTLGPSVGTTGGEASADD